MSCLEEKRAPMLPLKTLDIIFRRRYVQMTQFYFTNRVHADQNGKEKRKALHPFRAPKSEKLLSYLKYTDRMEKISAKNRLNKPLMLKENLKLAAVKDISQRLYIEEEPNDVRAIVDVDPEFYRLIEGRPVRCFDDINVYLENLRAYAMIREQIGFRIDLVYSIQQSIADESVEFDIILHQFRNHVKNFQKFLTEDYKKASAKVSVAEKVRAELVAKNAEFVVYVSSLTIVNNIIFKLDAIRSVLKVYRSFLIFVAPLSWRQEHDENLRGKIQSIQFECGEFVTDNDLVESLDIDKTVEYARKEFEDPQLVRMYFKSPKELMYLFRTMELQSREYLRHLANTGAHFRLLRDRVKQLKQATKQEFDYFQYYIDSIKFETERETLNAANLQEKFFRILNKTFFDSVASPATLKLKICIEYVYEQIFGKCEEGHQCILDPMKILEITYEDYNLRLDSLDFQIVNQARNDFFAQDLKMMNNAVLAQRELRAFREMTNAMNRAFMPQKHYTRPVLKKFVRKQDTTAKTDQKTAEVRKQKKYKLTEEEKEGLLLFTEWCHGMDPAPYLSDYYKFAKPALEMKPRKFTMP